MHSFIIPSKFALIPTLNKKNPIKAEGCESFIYDWKCNVVVKSFVVRFNIFLFMGQKEWTFFIIYIFLVIKEQLDPILQTWFSSILGGKVFL